MTNNFDIPIFQKAYELFKLLHQYQESIPKMERYTLWQKAQNTVLDILEGLLETSSLAKEQRIHPLQVVSRKLDMARIFIRLALETKIIDRKKYITLQESIDEIGRMLGGWIKNLEK